MQIAIVLSTGPFHRQAVIREHIQSQRLQLWQRNRSRDCVSVFFGTNIGSQNRLIIQQLQRRAARRRELRRRQRIPHCRLMTELCFPPRDSSGMLIGEQYRAIAGLRRRQQSAKPSAFSGYFRIGIKRDGPFPDSRKHGL